MNSKRWSGEPRKDWYKMPRPFCVYNLPASITGINEVILMGRSGTKNTCCKHKMAVAFINPSWNACVLHVMLILLQGKALNVRSMSFLSTEAVLLFVSNKNRDLWDQPLGRSNTGTPQFTDFASLCACSEWSLTNLIGWENEMITLRMLKKLDLPRGHNCWSWPKGAQPLGMRMLRYSRLWH